MPSNLRVNILMFDYNTFPFVGSLSLLILLQFACACQANFEDSRCRCTCPSTEYFSSLNRSNERRYYTKTNIDISICNTQTVVRQEVLKFVDESRLDAFLTNCNCKFETRNSLLLEVVVIFVMCALFLLTSYMAYLLIVEPVLKRQQPFAPYQRHSTSSDEMDENIFAQLPTPSTSVLDRPHLSDSSTTLQMRAQTRGNSDGQQASTSLTSNIQSHHIHRQNHRLQGAGCAGGGLSMGVGNSAGGAVSAVLCKVADRVVAEQAKWKTSVETQRRNVLGNHQMLN